jgi:glycosyltransferase involved in cell wall biosynthesis
MDYEWLIKCGIDQNKLLLAPNGLNARKHYRDFVKEPIFVFIGNLHYRPNAEAADLIVREIAPRVIDKISAARFLLIGDYPGPPRRTQASNIEFLGSVEDADRLMEGTLAGLAPIVSGSGMKVKMLSYGRLGLPVVATEKALAGYVRHDGFVCCSGMSDFAAEVVNLAMHPEHAFALGFSLRQQLINIYDWKCIFNSIDEAHETLLLRDRPSRASQSMRCFETEVIAQCKGITPLHLQEQRYKDASGKMICDLLTPGGLPRAPILPP